jgi:outer membrane lipoprotein-sorting protein
MKPLSLLLATALVAPVSSAVLHQPVAMAAVDANAILKMADERASIFKDQAYSASMEIFKYKDGRAESYKTLEFEMKMKGLEKQLIVFEAPGDVAGMKVLMQDADTLYVYSPEFKKVRRIAAHMRNQGFLGSDFTYEDMTQARLSGTFDAKLLGSRGKETTLELTPKPGATTTYPRLEIVIDSSKGGVTKLRYFDTSGAQVREQRREVWKKAAGELTPTRITMENLKTHDKTVITLSNLRVNQSIPDSTFSRRVLMRG